MDSFMILILNGAIVVAKLVELSLPTPEIKVSGLKSLAIAFLIGPYPASFYLFSSFRYSLNTVDNK